MKLDPSKPFFQTLREGVDYIETSVRKLKALADDEFFLINQPISSEDIIHVNQFDESVRSAFADVSLLSNHLGKPFNLEPVEERLNEMISRLIAYENDSGFKEFGYQPFSYPKLIETPVQEKSRDSNLTPTNGHSNHVLSQNKGENIPKIIGKDNDLNSRLLRSTFKVTSKKTFKSPTKSLVFKNGAFKINYLSPLFKNEEKELKKFSVIPTSLINQSPPQERPSNFRYINTDLIKSGNPTALSDVTPDGDGSQVTVEFTPGLSTKRPASKSFNGGLRPPSERRGSGTRKIDSSTVKLSPRSFPTSKNSLVQNGNSPNNSLWETPKSRLKNTTYRISSDHRINLRSVEKLASNYESKRLEDSENKNPQKSKDNIKFDPNLHQKLLSKMSRRL